MDTSIPTQDSEIRRSMISNRSADQISEVSSSLNSEQLDLMDDAVAGTIFHYEY